ncbi:hypothetical protein T492DRAFT_914020, partial [Pavlovales sp. CCMP2436]
RDVFAAALASATEPGLHVPRARRRREPGRPRPRGLRARQAPPLRRCPALCQESLRALRRQRRRHRARPVPLRAVRHQEERGVYGPVRRRQHRVPDLAPGALRHPRPGPAVPPARVLRVAPPPHAPLTLTGIPID